MLSLQNCSQRNGAIAQTKLKTHNSLKCVKTDTIFYRLFQSFPSIFFELINHVPNEASIYQFSSVEVKQLAFRIDGVFLPTTDAPEQPIYFTEVQFQADPQLYSRFFAEVFLYLNKTELTNDWRGAIIFPSRNVDTGATERYSELLSSRRVSRIYLDELIGRSSGAVPGHFYNQVNNC